MRTFFIIMGLIGCGREEREQTSLLRDPDPYVVPADTSVSLGEHTYFLEGDLAESTKYHAQFAGKVWSKVSSDRVTWTRANDSDSADMIITCEIPTKEVFFNSDHNYVHSGKKYVVFAANCADPDSIRTDLFHIMGHVLGFPDNDAPGKTYYVIRSISLPHRGGLPTDQEMKGLTEFFDRKS